MPSTQDLNYRDGLTGPVDAGIPVIDGHSLEEGLWDELVPNAAAAARERGFLCLDLTSSQEDAIRKALDAAKTFFALSNERKAQVRDTGSESGWTPSYEEPAYQPGTVSNVESFDIEPPLLGTPGDRHWPRVPGFQASVINCWQELSSLAARLLELLARAADVEARFFADNCDSGTLNTMRLLHYPAETQIPNPDEVGIAAHTDFECITLIHQTAAGLELRNIAGEWHDAPVAFGRLIVLFGDMLERWTNGYFQATGHRVRRTREERYSLVMFIAANDEVDVAPLPGFVSPQNPLRYEPVRQAEHIDREMARSRAQMQQQ